MNLQEEQKILKERIAELEEQEKQEREFPQYNDTYYHIEPNGRVDWFKWDEVDYDLEAQGIGNVFRTEQQAEFAAEKLKVEAELRKFSRPFKRDSLNFLMCFDTEEDKIYIETKRFMVQGAFYFESILQLDEAIQSVGEDRIKKYIFGVED